jgi:hypothetical protein
VSLRVLAQLDLQAQQRSVHLRDGMLHPVRVQSQSNEFPHKVDDLEEPLRVKTLASGHSIGQATQANLKVL